MDFVDRWVKLEDVDSGEVIVGRASNYGLAGQVGEYLVFSDTRVYRVTDVADFGQFGDLNISLGDLPTAEVGKKWGDLTLSEVDAFHQRVDQAIPRQVDCGCGKHKINPDGDPYEQHRLWCQDRILCSESDNAINKATSLAPPAGISAKKTFTLTFDDQYEC